MANKRKTLTGPQSLNRLPDGTRSPLYKVTATDGESEVTTFIREWWYDGKQVIPIDESIEDYFYSYFDKASFRVLSKEKVEDS